MVTSARLGRGVARRRARDLRPESPTVLIAELLELELRVFVLEVARRLHLLRGLRGRSYPTRHLNEKELPICPQG
jgi:hypothetical protein